VGSAIRGKQRGDIYFGTGAEAGAIAGRTKEKARFYILLPKR
jgi:membrane-bound lytic murein transglycosylase A